MFHDRAAMEEAVRALELEGVERRRISISRARATEEGSVRTPPELGPTLSAFGAVGSAIGAALALFAFALRDAGDPPFWLVAVRVLVGAASGAIAGGLAGLIAHALRRPVRRVRFRDYHDFLVKVRAPDEPSAEHVRDLLTRAGGDLLPA